MLPGTASRIRLTTWAASAESGGHPVKQAPQPVPGIDTNGLMALVMDLNVAAEPCAEVHH